MAQENPHLRQEWREEGVLLLTLDRPEALNALSQQMVDGLAAALERAERDRAVRCLVITGAGRGFCSGGDVRAMGRHSKEATAPGSEVEGWEARARELFFTADVLDAETALRYGLVNHLYPHEELVERGLELARRLAQGPVGAYGRMKEVLRAADAGDLLRALELEAMYMTLSGLTSEGRQFLRRFLEERGSRTQA
jgi:enoyl-CoA hydratase/carnithine racemase